LQQRLSDVAKELAVQTVTRDALRVDHASSQQRLRDCRDQLARLRVESQRFNTLWRTAMPRRRWSQDALPGARRSLRDEENLLTRAATHVAAARAAWTSEVRRERLSELTTAIEPLRSKLQHIGNRIRTAESTKELFHRTYNEVSRRQIDDLSRVVNPLFARMHANRVYDTIKLGQVDDPVRWLAQAGSAQLDPGKDFSQGQRQDLALALFLARARSIGGTFFLDEPVTHLDDLNRVGLLDILRATAMENSNSLNLVITTASKSLARHLIEKFSSIDLVETPDGRTKPLRVVEMDGNSRAGVTMRSVYPAIS
jgi:exonuclease SbcC